MQRSELQKPKIKRYKKSGGFVAWFVDGKYIRDHMNGEFTNFGWQNRFPFIPTGEFWIDAETSPGEAKYYFGSFLIIQEVLKKGLSYEQACLKADRAEKKERATTEFYKIHKNLPRVKKENSVHKKLLSSWGKKLEIWLVDGEKVRTLFFLDFTEGGHDKVYDFIPDNEVWLDDDLVKEERDYVLVHELIERFKMAYGMAYDDAHYGFASPLEKFCRKTKILTKIILFLLKFANFVFVR
jgi:hypothetical protein